MSLWWGTVAASRLRRACGAFVVTVPRIAVTASVALLVGLVPGVHAYATPSVAEVESKIDKLWNQLEPLIEKYDAVHDELRDNQAEQDKLSKQIAPLRTQVGLARARAGAMSARLYMRGPGSRLNALLRAGSPELFAERLTALDQLARHQQRTISQVRTEVEKYDQRKQKLDALVAKQKKQVSDLAARKKDIQGQIDKLKKLRQQAYAAAASAGGGSSGGSLKPVSCPHASGSGSGYQAAEFACSQIGKPYVFAQDGPDSYDCSGLTKAAWASVGVSLPHNAYQQKHSIKSISASDLRVGDLIFYGSDVHHVAIYVGNGWMVHAPKAGDQVRMAKIGWPGSISGYGRP